MTGPLDQFSLFDHQHLEMVSLLVFLDGQVLTALKQKLRRLHQLFHIFFLLRYLLHCQCYLLYRHVQLVSYLSKVRKPA